MIETNFKYTDIGLIPHDWEMKSLGASALIKARIGWQGLTTKEYLDDGPYYLITGTDFRDGKIDWSGCHFVTKERYDQDKFIQIKPQDVLISKDGTIGKVAYLDYIPGEGTLNSGVFVIRSKDKQISQPYMALAFLSKYFDDFIDKIVAGSTIVHLYQKDIVSFAFPVPPTIDEQRRIAEALQNIDSLIEALDEQIAKKQAIKIGAMQQLLTAKTRLQGFTEDWKTMELCEVLDYEQPTRYLVSSTEYIDKGTPVLTAGKTFILGYTDEDFGIYTKLPVIIFDDFVTESKYVDFPFKVKSSAIKMLQLKNKSNNLRFVYELMQLIDFPVADHKRWWISQYSKIKIKLPLPEEQNAIAEVLSNMDAEIQTLQEERNKYALIKQGMMQDLLTGKIRI